MHVRGLKTTLLFTLLVFAPALFAQSGRLQNMGAGLRELVEAHRSGQLAGLDLRGSQLTIHPSTGRRVLAYGSRRHMLVDRQNRVMVRILLDGSAPLDQMRGDLRRLGAAIVADDAAYRRGAIEAYIPLGQAESIAQMRGVAAMNLLHTPVHAVGAVTTQGAALLHSDQVNSSGVTGKGITIGILSDSFNLNAIVPNLDGTFTFTALDDVNSGDLPSIGVADGRPGLKFLSEGPEGGLDEGRAMAQIAYDMAPGTSFCFASASDGPFAFAANIRRLRTDSQCAADILMDDTVYLDEPAFSDGPIAQAVNDVANSTTLAGKRVVYFASAQNSGGTSYASPLRFVDDATARGLTGLPIDLSQISSTVDTSGGFHNFNPDPNGPPILSQTISVSQALPSDVTDILLQWDDPFDLPNGVTTDLNLLVFSSSGKYLGASFDNNFQTMAPFEGVSIAGNFSFRIVIARTGGGTQQASRVLLAPFNPIDPIATEFADSNMGIIFGHPTAKGAIAVAAYNFDSGIMNGQATPELESFSSAGPVSVCCDAGGTRLPAAEVRQKPEVAGVDGVLTTFFDPSNPDFGDPYFTFFGTSAAVPHVAGIAALMLQSAGGPGSLTPDQIRSRLIASTGTHDLDPYYSQAVLGDATTGIKLSARGGDAGNVFPPPALTDPKFFTLQFTSPNSGQTLNTLSIDLGPTNLFFNVNSRSGFRMTVGSAPTGVQVTSTVTGAGSTVLTLTFNPGLAPGSTVQFGVGRAQRTTRSGGVSADLLQGAMVSATLAGPAAQLTGTFVNQTGTGYVGADGWGLVDAMQALQAK